MKKVEGMESDRFSLLFSHMQLCMRLLSMRYYREKYWLIPTLILHKVICCPKKQNKNEGTNENYIHAWRELIHNGKLSAEFSKYKKKSFLDLFISRRKFSQIFELSWSPLSGLDFFFLQKKKWHFNLNAQAY